MATTIRTVTSALSAAALMFSTTGAIAQESGSSESGQSSEASSSSGGSGSGPVCQDQEFQPNKPIDMVIMAGKGGGADGIARFIQGVVQKRGMTPQPFVPNNKPGGSGAESFVALEGTNNPDTQVMVTLNSFYTTPMLQEGLDVDQTEYAPLGRMAEDTFVLWVNSDTGIETFDGFLKAVRDSDDWVMGGTGSNQEDELITNFLNNEFDLDIRYIPYSGGGEVARQLAGGQIDSTVNNPAEQLGFFQSGDTTPLVAFTDERLDLFPDTPTLKEEGTDFSYLMQRAVVGPPDMSDAAQQYYSCLLNAVYQTDEWQGYMEDQALSGKFLTGDDLVSYWKEQLDRNRKMLQQSGRLN